jgi:hypothetical protein
MLLGQRQEYRKATLLIHALEGDRYIKVERSGLWGLAIEIFLLYVTYMTNTMQ